MVWTVDDVGGLYAYGRDGSITHYSRNWLEYYIQWNRGTRRNG